MSVVAVPSSLPLRRRIPWMLILALAVVAVGIAWVAVNYAGRTTSEFAGAQFYAIAPMDMDITISKDGELQAVNNVDITNPLEGQSTIIDIAKEGDFVHKGDVVVKFDSSDIQQKIESAQLDLQRAEADLTAAREAKEIQESSNAADLEAANVDLVLARLDLQQYVEGTYPSDLQQAKTAVDMAKIEVKNKEDDLDQTRSLFGKGFVTAADVKTAELALLKAKNDLDQKTTDLEVLEKYTHEKEVTDRRNKVAQAEKKLLRVQRINASNLSQKQADLDAKDRQLTLRKQQMDHMQEQFADCTIKAPGDGMVVYSSSISGGWRRDTPIQPGAQVRQQEMLIRLPDTSAMKAVCKINEAQVTKLRVDPNNPIRATVKLVGRPTPLTGWLSNISIMADNNQRWFNPDAKDYPVDVTLDSTPPGLKPGIGVEQVKLFIDHIPHTLAVPLGAVYAAGDDSYVFVRDGDAVRPTKVKLGAVNETHAQVLGGVAQGDACLILEAGQGRELLERAGIKVKPPSSTQPSFNGKMPPRPPQANVTAAPAVEKNGAAGAGAGNGSNNGNGGRRRGGDRGDRNGGGSSGSQSAAPNKTSTAVTSATTKPAAGAKSASASAAQ